MDELVKEPLAVAAAALFRLATDTYWRLAASSHVGRVESARIACESYQLGDELVYYEPDDGWDDENLVAVGVNLIAFADLFAASSIEWPVSQPVLAAPVRELAEASFRESGIEPWLSDVLAGVPIVRDVDDWISRYRNVCRFDKSTPDLDPDDEGLAALRERERPEGSQYGQVLRASAEFLQSAMRGYVNLYRGLEDPDATSFFEVAEEHRGSMLEAMAWGRQCMRKTR